ncbi:histidinol-phosphate transaminase [Cognatilysobacter segetis]|uniref:histidinol-phosphate transaminase n=1 Tax=Cognatilysobacter segetis TaxID=2492394 RepID=UPI00105D9DEA|nr:histidinol-phosphate transaminase [Lysobacter segetis]
MSGVLDLVRADLRDFAGYRSARTERVQGDVWLNANESARANAGDAEGAYRRYPDPQPEPLRERLAALYGVRAARVLAGRGSDEGIDLLVRALCVPGHGAIVITPPTFGMYAVCARLHGARVVEAPLVERGEGFQCDFTAVARKAEAENARLVFLCSPGNPTGASLPLESIAALACRLERQSVVVVDEAYQEFASTPSALTLLDRHPNLVVLRTLSKAHALAGVRLGVAIGNEALIEVLRRCQAPYPLPAPCIDAVMRATDAAVLEATRGGVAATIAERTRLAVALADAPGVRRVYPSDANFLLVRFDDADAAFATLLAAGVVVRDMRAQAALGDALRITVGTAAQNDRVLSALTGVAA